MSFDTIICPHCGYVYQMDLARYKQEREATVAKSLSGKDKTVGKSFSYVDLKCPNSSCGKWFEWEVK